MSSFSGTPKLSYFNLRGLGEVSRFVLAASGTSYTDFRYPIDVANGYARPEFDAAKKEGAFPMGQVPVLELEGGFKLAQSKAIERYLAKKTGLMGSTDEEAATIDSVCELCNDVRTKFDAEKADAEKLAKFNSEYVPAVIKYFENYIAESGYVNGNKISLADIRIYSLVESALAGALPAGQEALDLFKASAKIAKVVANVAGNEGIAAWIASRPVTVF